jgi:hypothetical protein
VKSYGQNVLIFKQNSIWRVMGTDPGQFVVREQYGNGSVAEDTICTYNDVVWMLGYGGLRRYDGSLAIPYKTEETSGILRDRMTQSAWSKAVAVMKDRTYCLAIALDGAEENNAVLEFNVGEGTFSLRTGVHITSFVKFRDKVYYTTPDDPYNFHEYSDIGNALPVKWVSAYQDLGLKSSVKSGFEVYLNCEAETPFDLVVGIRTEKKLKSRRVHIKPGKTHKLTFNVMGRQFRLEMHTNTIVPFAIKGGIRIALELDPD